MLSALSIFGVAQSMILSVVLFKKRNSNAFNKHLSALFLLLALAMLTITMSEVFVSNVQHLFEIFEFSLTLSAGPILYIISENLLEKNLSKKKVLIHFIPVILFLIASVASSNDTIGFLGVDKLPVMVPVIHMQLYTLWLSWILLRCYRDENFESDTGFNWLVIISVLLISIHLAQWIRFFYSDVEWLELIVPATAFLGVYGLAFYGFLRSGFFFKRNKKEITFFSEDEEKMQADVLLRIIDEKEVYQDPELTLVEFSRIAGIPAYKVSHLINKTLNTGFNDWINSYRIEKVKCLLNDPSKNYLTIEAIAREAGFNSRSAFYHAFNKETGMTPAEFRRIDSN